MRSRFHPLFPSFARSSRSRRGSFRGAAALLLPLVAFVVLLAGDALAARGGHRGNRDHHGSTDRIEGSGQIETRTLDLEAFDRIQVDGVADVEVRVGPEFSVTLTTDDNLIEFVDIHVRRGHLVIDKDDGVDLHTDHGVLVVVEMPELAGVGIDGVCNMDIRGLDGESFEIDVDGVGNVVAEGRVTRLHVQMDGVSELELADLEAEEAEVDLDGVGDVEVHVTKRLRAEVDGMGSLRYRGRPEIVRESVGGFGEIIPLGS